MRNGEGCHRLDDTSDSAREDDKRQHEQEMVDSQQDVFDAELRVGGRQPHFDAE